MWWSRPNWPPLCVSQSEPSAATARLVFYPRCATRGPRRLGPERLRPLAINSGTFCSGTRHSAPCSFARLHIGDEPQRALPERERGPAQVSHQWNRRAAERLALARRQRRLRVDAKQVSRVGDV